MTYNEQGKRITYENLAGQVKTTAWDQFACTPVGELIPAAKSAKSAEIAYGFGDIGNRLSSSERGTNSVYAANLLNQYCSITTLTSDVGLQTSSFSPQYDDGNQTLVKTATSIWQVSYNGENRSGQWTLINSSTPNSSTSTLLSMSYDRMGRRVTKNDVMNLLRRQEPMPVELAETLMGMIEERPVAGFGRSGRAGVPPPAADGDGTPTLPDGGV